MQQSSFVKMLRGLVHDFYNEDGSVGTNKKSFGGHVLDANSTKVLEALVELVINTDYLVEEVKKYLKGYSIEEIKQLSNEEVSINTLKSRIFYQINRVKKRLGEEAVEQIVTTKSKEVLKLYYKKIKTMKKELEEKSLLDNMTLRIPKNNEAEVSDISKDDLEVLNDLVIRYSKEGKKIAEKLLTNNMAGYIRYLERKQRTNSLESGESEHFELFIRYLK